MARVGARRRERAGGDEGLRPGDVDLGAGERGVRAPVAAGDEHARSGNELRREVGPRRRHGAHRREAPRGRVEEVGAAQVGGAGERRRDAAAHHQHAAVGELHRRVPLARLGHRVRGEGEGPAHRVEELRARHRRAAVVPPGEEHPAVVEERGGVAVAADLHPSGDGLEAAQPEDRGSARDARARGVRDHHVEDRPLGGEIGRDVEREGGIDAVLDGHPVLAPHVAERAHAGGDHREGRRPARERALPGRLGHDAEHRLRDREDERHGRAPGGVGIRSPCRSPAPPRPSVSRRRRRSRGRGRARAAARDRPRRT